MNWIKENAMYILIAWSIACPLAFYGYANQSPAKVAYVEPTVYACVTEATTEEVEMVSLGEFKLTAYCSCSKCCGKWAKNRPKDKDGNEIVYGALGIELEEGTSIAVDSDVIPYGSTVYINGHAYTAHDTGGAVKGKHIDIYFADHQKAVEFGVQHAEVFQ